MSERQFETVIIGAGPAGMGCAIPLQKAGKSVCVLDKAVFPRAKTCAGLVTGKTYRLISSLFDGGDTDDLFCCTCDEIRLFRRTKLLVSAPIEHPVRLVNRSHFDNALVAEYKRLGGEILEGEKHIVIDHDMRRITLQNGDEIAYRYLLFADGALSMARRLMPADIGKLAFGIEAYLPAEQLPTKSVDLYFDYLDSGYVWVFPHGDTVCVGAADQYNRRTDYLKLFNDILADLGVSPDGVRLVGAFLPYGEAIQQEQLADNILLLGDAAGFTDPISGEGLYMALESGARAAEALKTPSPKQAYLDSVKPLIRTVKDGKKVQKTFYSPLIQKVFLKKVEGKSNLVAHFFEQMVDDYHYEYREVRKMLSDYQKSKKE